MLNDSSILYYIINAQPRFLLLRRSSTTDILESSRERASTRRDVFDTGGPHNHHPKEQVVIEAQRGGHEHPPQQPPAHPVATTTYENVRGDKLEPDTIYPQSGGGRTIKGLGTQERKAGGSGRLAKDEIVLGTHRGFEVTLAPAFGDVLGDACRDSVGDPKDKHRLNKVRWGVLAVHRGMGLV